MHASQGSIYGQYTWLQGQELEDKDGYTVHIFSWFLLLLVDIQGSL